MATCIHCFGPRVATLTGAKAVEVTIFMDGIEDYVGEVPGDMGLGDGGDYVDLTWCLDCLSIQVPGPLPKCAIEPSRPRKAGRRPDGPLPDLADMASQFGGLCRCGARFAKGDPIQYSRVAGEVLRCPKCFTPNLIDVGHGETVEIVTMPGDRGVVRMPQKRRAGKAVA